MQVWDINEEPPVDLSGSQSLVACSDIAPTCSEIAPALAHLAAALVEGGFLLLREFTGPHALLLHALADGAAPPRRVQWTKSDARCFIALCAEARGWELPPSCSCGSREGPALQASRPTIMSCAKHWLDWDYPPSVL